MQNMASVLGMIAKHLGIHALLNTVALLQLGKLFPHAAGRGVIFTLHHVRPATNLAFDPNGLLDITPEFLEATIVAIKEAGHIPVRLEDLPALLASPDRSKKYVCFTLDDGNKDNAEYAAPIFRKHNIPYTIFVCPGLSMRARTMWWETVAVVLRENTEITFDFGAGPETLRIKNNFHKQAMFFRFAKFVEGIDEDLAVERIDALAKSVGINPMAIVEREIMTVAELRVLAKDPLVTFGGHTMTHTNLANATADRMMFELLESCKLISEYSGKAVTTFAYPYGHSYTVGKREFQAAADIGLKLAVTTQPGVLKNCSQNHLTALKRVSLNGWYQHTRFVKALVSGVPFLFMK
jgi:peptidoglycan/xylan/chitin deacetylase (PgdA/CDA1 family)